MFVGDAFTVFHSTAPDTHHRVGGEFPDNSVFKGRNLLSIKWFIIQPSKTKTTCQNHQNLLSKPAVKTIKTIKTTCQNHQNLLSKHQNHQNHLSKSSKPAVKIIKNIKTCCHLLYSLQKQKPPVKIIKTCCQNHQKHQNLLSFIIQPSKTKTTCQNHQKHQNLLSKHQNHQNLLSKHQNHQNHLSKSSKPTVNNIKTIKTTCQKHQNLLSW